MHAADPKPPFTLTIVPDLQPRGSSVPFAMANKKPHTFHVVLTNTL